MDILLARSDCKIWFTRGQSAHNLPGPSLAVPGEILELVGVYSHEGYGIRGQRFSLVDWPGRGGGCNPQIQVDSAGNPTQHIAVGFLYREFERNAPGAHLAWLKLNPLLVVGQKNVFG